MERNKREFNNISELLEALSPYISARALARIVGMGESQMLQYKAGIKKISPQNIARINEKLRNFAAELSEERNDKEKTERNWNNKNIFSLKEIPVIRIERNSRNKN